MTKVELHIGKMIRDRLKEDGRSASWLAKKIHCKRDNIYKIFQRTSIDTALLLRISCVLKTNFFACMSDLYEILEKDVSEEEIKVENYSGSVR